MSFKVFDNTVSYPENLTDAFHRLKVSEPYTQFESTNFYGGLNPQSYYSQLGGAGTIEQIETESSINLKVTTASGDYARVRSKEYFVYHPGKSQLILMTGSFGARQANTVKRIGYFDDSDGIFFVQDGANGIGVCIRSNTTGTPVDTIIYQADWNLDPMDGTGKSGVTFDEANVQIFFMDFQWLGTGSVRFGLEHDHILHWVHEQHHANKATKVYMRTPNLPITGEIENVGTAAAGSAFKVICATVITEGSEQATGYLYSTPNSVPVTVASGVWTPVISVKANTQLGTFLYRGRYYIQSIEIFVDGNQPMAFGLYENANIATPTWLKVNANSGLEYDVTSATMNVATSNSIRRLISFVPAGAKESIHVDPPELVKGVANSEFTVAAMGLSGASTVRAAINVREVI